MLEILRNILQAIEAANSLLEALQIMVSNVRDTFGVQACSVYLLDDKKTQYVLIATDGLNPKVVFNVKLHLNEGLVGYVGKKEEPVNVENAHEHPKFLYYKDAGEENFSAFLGVPIIYRKKLLGVLVVQSEDRKKFAEEEVAFLMTISTQLAGTIAYAESVGELRELFFKFVTKTDRVENIVYKGLPAVSGVGIGTGIVIYPIVDFKEISIRRTKNIEKEIQLLDEAVEATLEDMKNLRKKMKGLIPSDVLGLFSAYIRILDNSSFINEIKAYVRQGIWAQSALKKVIDKYVQKFEAMDDEYLKERAIDIEDLGRRILSHLQAESPEIIIYPEKTILIGEEITASHIMEVPEGKLVGIVSLRGSANSHTAIVAKSLNIPMIVGAKGILFEKLKSQTLVVDGYSGQVYLEPSQRLLNDYYKLIYEEKELTHSLEKLRSEEAETLDGYRVRLFVNIGLVADAGMSLSVGAEGVGLFRTELPFLIKDRFPSEEEQKIIYRQLLKAFAPRAVVMRTLDIGGDKMLPYFPIKGNNLFLGWRGIRVTLDHPEIFLIQLRALLKANIELNNLQILLPMISSVEEIDGSMRLIHQAYRELVEEGFKIVLPPIGIMLEVPSAIFLIKELAQKVDFISVGSNDLIQYILAVDRNNIQVANLYEPLHPAIIRVLTQIAQEVHLEGKLISICGEMASDPLVVILLLAMGFDVLSMNSPSLPRVKCLIRNFTLSQARKILNEVLDMDNAATIRLYLENVLEDANLSYLINKDSRINN